METVSEFMYLDDRVSACGGCEAAVTGKMSCGWINFVECSELLYFRRFPLKLNGAVYKSYVKLAMLYRSETWCLKENELVFYKAQKDPL